MVLVNFLIPTEANSSSMSICLSANSEVGVTLRVSHSTKAISIKHCAIFALKGFACLVHFKCDHLPGLLLGFALIPKLYDGPQLSFTFSG